MPSIQLTDPHPTPGIAGHSSHASQPDVDKFWTWDGTSTSNDNFAAVTSNHHDYSQPLHELTSAASEINYSSLVGQIQVPAAVTRSPLSQDVLGLIGAPLSGHEGRLSQSHKGGVEAFQAQQQPAPGYRRGNSHASVSEYLLHAPPIHPKVTPSPPSGMRMSSLELELHLSNSSTRSIISDGLYRIYRDSLECALSCWLTEWTCPYNVGGRAQFRLNRSQSHSEAGGPGGKGSLGTFFTRICRLDRSLAKWRTRPLSPAEDKAASRVLEITIVAYASQWSQLRNPGLSAENGNCDRRDTPPNNSRAFGDKRTMPSDLDRSFQEALWHQARKSLQCCEDKESFRVIFAHLIFSIIQRQLNVQEHARKLRQKIPRYRHRSCPSLEQFSHGLDLPATLTSVKVPSEGSDSDVDVSVRTKLEELDGLEGPPVFLETALRQLLCWRRQIGLMSRKAAASSRADMDQSGASSPSQIDQDRKSFNMLFWLGVMCDTSSAAVYNRPLVISDEDSAIILPTHPSSTSLGGKDVTHDMEIDSNKDVPNLPISDVKLELWDADFLERKIYHSQSPLRWPCSVADAAAALSEATPCKVLLYRKVASLQALSLRAVSPQTVERYIQQALAVYQHWNQAYGPFIDDCLNHHNELPSSVKSWYVVHIGHWYLGALLLADVIDTIDEDHKSGLNHRELRETISLTHGLRKDNVDAATDLARATCSSDPELGNGLQDSPYTFDKMALLSEPWTGILTKCFCKTLELLLQWLSACKRANNGTVEAVETECLQSQAQICVQALETLGRKSDAAYLAAMLFSDQLREVIAELDNSTPTYDGPNVTAKPDTAKVRTTNG
jgi:hypothetical protein